MEKSSLFNIRIIIVLILLIASSLFIIERKIGDKDNMQKFDSYEELQTFINSTRAYLNYYGFERAIVSDVAAAEAFDSGLKSAEPGASYSTTNIQVEGVDEPDIVKTDGKYIYTVSGNKVFIIEAYPAENMKEVSKIEFNESIGVRNIFINDDKLIVFLQEYNYYPSYYKEEELKIASSMIVRPSEAKTIVNIYDISDKANPKLENTFSAKGNFIDARMIDNKIYVISSQYIYQDNIILPVFEVNDVKKEILATDIFYPGYIDQDYVFTSIMEINIDNSNFNSQVYLTGATQTIYVSEKNIYLSGIKYLPYEDYFKKMVEEVYFEILPNLEADEVREILSSNEETYIKNDKIQKIVYDYSNSLNGDEKSQFDKELLDKMQEFELKIAKENEKTIISKINIENGIEYFGNGEVPGHILNQFSMDEYKGDFRISTTSGNWGDNTLNHLYILDENLEIIGKVEDLAKGERIYSTRFIEDRAYVVTFKQIDPLFVIDLSNSENPKVLGYLKVTGFSNYLHPYDENTIIGIGREASEEGRAEGIKIALFDVSDVQNPKELAKYEVENKWSYSNALDDHKAFLFDKAKNLLVIPISYQESSNENQYKSWNGAYAFNINKESIELKGKISHNNGDYNYDVQRSLYINNVLYTISYHFIKASDLDSLNEINSFKLPIGEQVVYYADSEEVNIVE